MIALAVVPALVVVATLVSRRFGHGVGGVMAGLPLTSGPLSLTLAVDHGTTFAARAAVGSLIGITASTLACVVYGSLAPRGVAVATTAGSAAFAVGVAAGVPVPVGLVGAVALAAGATALGLAVLRSPAVGVAAPPPLGILPRAASAVCVAALVLVVAHAAGARLAGAVTPFPVVIGVLCVHAQREQGATAAVELLRGSLRGTFGFIAFFAVVGELVGRPMIAAVYALAVAAALAAAGLGLRRRPPGDASPYA